MTLYEEVVTLTEAFRSKYDEVEYATIASVVKTAAIKGLSRAYIFNEISEPVKRELRKQGFEITYEITSENNHFRYAIKW